MAVYEPAAQPRIASLKRAAEMIPKALLANEAMLMRSKWYDYRFIDPFEATARFAQAYLDVYGYVYGDQPMFQLMSDEALPQTWKIRQCADSWGLPYDKFWRIIFSNYRQPRRILLSKLVTLPGMNDDPKDNLRFRIKCLKFVKEERGAALHNVSGDQYRIEAFVGLSPQLAFRHEVVRDTAARRNWLCGIGHFTVNARQVPVDCFTPLMDAEAKERVWSMRESIHIFERSAFSHPEGHLLWLACFGLPGARNLSTPACRDCGQAEGCKILGQFLGDDVREEPDRPVVRDPKAEAMAKRIAAVPRHLRHLYGGFS